jgi:hypothetical protein
LFDARSGDQPANQGDGYASRLQSGDAKEAITAFFEKRQADFTKSKATA